MPQINSYLTFSGNCREAMTFYQKCLGGVLYFQTIGESPISQKMPQRMKDCILHATLTRDNLVLMASDMVSEDGLKKGNAVSLMLACDSEEEVRACFEKLSVGGLATHPVELTFFDSLLGNLTDKFGNNWLLNYSKK
ncbi:VOC family protein [Reichenbachiella sp. MALMAid0571]|uniref:VOC family protein n=1 Tax=Reichenbachiella sp. MALMAid0571 TaxID=3143939 RepID=UPI0032DEC0EB